MARDTTAAPLEAQPELKRAIGPKLLFFFVIGDILGTGIYALTGNVAGRIGGALWVPFLVAFVLAFLTAFSYLELVGKYPKAAGAALYTNRAFRHPVPHVHGRLRRHVLRHHVGVLGGAGVRRDLPAGTFDIRCPPG